MKHIKFFTIITAALLIFQSCQSGEGNEELNTEIPVAPAENPGLPSFKMTDTKGNILNLADLKGKKVFVNLWASWCGPCRSEMPSIQELYEKTKNENVTFVMLALDNDFQESIGFLKEQGLVLPAYYPGETLPEIFNVPGIPTTFIFDEKGELIKKIEGSDKYNTNEYIKLLSN
ncbi:MAG: TlpA family protein disulfide reductase [Flavitalea sp.]